MLIHHILVNYCDTCLLLKKPFLIEDSYARGSVITRFLHVVTILKELKILSASYAWQCDTFI